MTSGVAGYPDSPMPAPLVKLLRTLSALVCVASVASAQRPVLDERPCAPGEWGQRPVDGATIKTNPPAFVWRPQKGATEYKWQASLSPAFTIGMQNATVTYPVYCPAADLAPGTWYWHFRFTTKDGTSDWSKTRRIVITKDAKVFAMPSREEIKERLPKEHPRLFVRPEGIPTLKKKLTDEKSNSPARKAFVALLERCETLHADSPATKEPDGYPKGTIPRSEAWRKIWWGNRVKTIRVLSAAADLAFAAHITGDKRHAELSKRLLLEVAKWDPKGSTGFKTNDEAAMPYAYWFARTYTFLHGSLTKEERATCQKVLSVRGGDMYRHLAPGHLFQPYGSHNNRLWHFLGEVGIALFGEVDAAEEWVWFASRVFGAVYPAWSDEDGGWHEGLAYWHSYLNRFTWWADIQKSAYGVDSYDKPFFSKVGDLILYLQTPGTTGGGFGDQTAKLGSGSYGAVMRRFAQAAKNGHWEWHASQGGISPEPGFIGVLRQMTDLVKAEEPKGLPTSKLFRGTGLAVLNHTLLGAKDNVQVVFKSSPFGTQSHGYEAQNSFLLYAFGERLLIRTGKRDIYGSEHHTKWMWSTRSTNCITTDGEGQLVHSAKAKGAITAFSTSAEFDYVVGEAGEAYPDLSRFTRRILFVKPDYIVIHDTLNSDKPRKFEWWLHAIDEMKLEDGSARIVRGNAACTVKWLVPEKLGFAQTDKFDPPPRKRAALTEHHVTATTPTPTKEMTFVTVIRPHRSADTVEFKAVVESIKGGHRVRLDDAVVIELVGDRTTATRGKAKFDSARR
jgi:hypothetical protein